MIPSALRSGMRFRRLVQVLTSHTVGDAGEAEVYKESTKAEHKNIGQKMVMEGLLRDKFGEGIVIAPQEGGTVRMFGKEYPYVVICPMTGTIITSVKLADVGCDFVVKVPANVSVDEVKAYVGKFVFAGVGFRVENL